MRGQPLSAANRHESMRQIERRGSFLHNVIHTFDALILGGGAAGLMCAIEAGKRERRVAVLEHADRLGKKILISGGGRCNFTNLNCQPENFLSSNPHFAKSALSRYTPADFIALVEKHRIPYHEKTLGALSLFVAGDGSTDMVVRGKGPPAVSTRAGRARCQEGCSRGEAGY
jgi:hypothetical protein